MKDVMIDIETLGKGPNKVICQIGAVYFDSTTGELGEEFKCNINAEDHERLGGKLDANTIYWWLKQSDAARNSILAEPRQPIVAALNALNDFLAPSKRIWSHATFDFVTIMDTFRTLGITPKFSYKQGLDLRTLVYLAGTKVDAAKREGTHHDGLDDAKHQVKYCVTALNAVKTNKKALALLEKLAE